MLNETQQQLLRDFFGKDNHGDDGSSIGVIKEYKGVDLGTKLLYLERATTEDCGTFLKSLDKLYNPELSDLEKEDHLSFIKELKFINNFYFNNETLYGNNGVRNTTTHYLSAVGDFELEEVQRILSEMIDRAAIELKQGQPEEAIQAQKNARLATEANRPRYVSWREEPIINLPLNQRNIIDSNFQNLLDLDIPREVLLALPGDVLDELRERSLNVINLVDTLRMPYTHLLALSAHVRTALLDNSLQICDIVRCCDNQLANVLQLPEDVISIFLNNISIYRNNIFDIESLNDELSTSLRDLLTLPSEILTELVTHTNTVLALCKNQPIRISFEMLKGLPIHDLRTVLENPDSNEAQLILNPPLSNPSSEIPSLSSNLFAFQPPPSDVNGGQQEQNNSAPHNGLGPQ